MLKSEQLRTPRGLILKLWTDHKSSVRRERTFHCIHLEFKLSEVLDEALHCAGSLQCVVYDHASKASVHRPWEKADAQRSDKEAERAHKL